ncbi:MAG: hypothetical protein HQM10_05220 [Candidatus Riflebacteria bacterium]|nr:hypothetical protein [Candidatus Riflebacteria bacterium]
MKIETLVYTVSEDKKKTRLRMVEGDQREHYKNLPAKTVNGKTTHYEAVLVSPSMRNMKWYQEAIDDPEVYKKLL